MQEVFGFVKRNLSGAQRRKDAASGERGAGKGAAALVPASAHEQARSAISAPNLKCMTSRCQERVDRRLDLNRLVGWVSKFCIEQLTDSCQRFSPVMAFAFVSVSCVPCDIGKHQAPSASILPRCFQHDLLCLARRRPHS